MSILAVVIFAGLTAWDTQAIKEMYFSGDSYEMVHKKSIHGALRLYLDFINMFQAILMLTGRSATTDRDRQFDDVSFPRPARREPGIFSYIPYRARRTENRAGPFQTRREPRKRRAVALTTRTKAVTRKAAA